MKVFSIITRGMCANGRAIVLADSETQAKQIFKKSLENECNEPENEITKVIEVDTNIAQVIYYDDGDR